jgi:PAS domain S-box-containing protein
MSNLGGYQMARDALNQYRRHFEYFFKKALDAIVLFDTSALILDANPAACALFGYGRDELRQLTASNLTPVENQGKILELMRSLITEGTLSGNFTVLTRSGDRRAIEFHSVANILPDVHKTILRDVTDCKEAEASPSLCSLPMKVLSRRVIELQEEERRYLARELHDEIGQVLGAASISLAMSQDASDAEARSQLAKSIDLIDSAIQHVRGLSLDLWPLMLDDIGLVSTLRWYADRQAQQGGFILHFVADSSAISQPPIVETTCYRVVQEALSNVDRHAGASEVWLEVRSNDAELELMIRDNGVGFDASTLLNQPASNRSSGLLAMRERVESIGGRFTIESESNLGTTIHAWIPATP